MKTRNVKLFSTGIATLLLSVSCSNDFIEQTPTGQVTEANYYKDASQAYAGVVSVYDIMGKHSGGFENMVAMFNAGSDDFYAGGGNAGDGAGIQSFSNYSINEATIPRSFWGDYYQGIFRANTLLSHLEAVPMDEALKSRFRSETKALRGYYYFQLILMFKSIPLITEPLSPEQFLSVEQATREAVWAQIELDLTEAANDPNLPNTLNNTTEGGRLSKGAVKAILGKVYLEQHKNTEAATVFAEVNGTPGGTSQYGYHLLSNFADLWITDNKFNSESILEATHTQKSHALWGDGQLGFNTEGNILNIMMGPRGYAPANGGPDYKSGWSFNPVTVDLYTFMQDDPRFDSTVADLQALVAGGQASYTPGYKDTGYFLKKFMPKNADLSAEAGAPELNYRQNSYVIRLADTYLLEAEALNSTGPRAQALLDAVRARVGLASVPVTPQAVADERRRELAGEGHRFRDLVRTGRAATVLAPRGFVAGKHEFFPIPLLELSNTLIEQDPAYL
ncbi:RagB/SusD family nutrient uptake outer membrane protein [Flavobacterium sp. RHBU_24]|uniref:RagB/SusD family nutrient uptake outer membrane protein n=1 Tax=Flavobacterium sp. RHBU_24 TaxID=3391185 RepID=UPI003984FDDE